MWRTEWDALSARIAAFLEAAHFLLSTGTARQEFYGASELADNGKRIAECVHRFQADHGPNIPHAAARTLAEWKDPTRAWGAGLSPQSQVQHMGIVLQSLRAEMNHLLTSPDTVGRSLVARAFQHLQRSIIADEAVRTAWQTAYETGETSCERLGACHLLLHGIWAFKAITSSERTDLVLGEPLRITEGVRAAAEVLVLTEWKVLRERSELAEVCQHARREAGIYAASVLAGFELASRRYLIVVSKDRRPMPEPEPDGEVTYEYLNVAVDPASPSADAGSVRSRRAKIPLLAPRPAPGSLQAVEEEQIRKALAEARGNKTIAAGILRIERKTLYRKLARMRLNEPRP